MESKRVHRRKGRSLHARNRVVTRASCYKQKSTNSRNFNNDHTSLKHFNKPNENFQTAVLTQGTSNRKTTCSSSKRSRRKSCGCCPCLRCLNSEEIIQLTEEPEGVERMTSNPGRNLRLEDDIITTLEELPLDEIPPPPKIEKKKMTKKSLNKSVEVILGKKIVEKNESQLNNEIEKEQKKEKTALGSDSVIALEKKDVVEAEKEAELETKIEKENFLDMQNGSRSKGVELKLPLIDKSYGKQRGDSGCLSSEKSFRKYAEESPTLKSLTFKNQKEITIPTNLQLGLEDSYKNFSLQYPLSFITSIENKHKRPRQLLPFFVTEKSFDEALPSYLTHYWFKKIDDPKLIRGFDLKSIDEKLIKELGPDDDIIQKVIRRPCNYKQSEGKQKWNLNKVKGVEGFTNETVKNGSTHAINKKSIKKFPTKYVSSILPLINETKSEQEENFCRKDLEDLKEDTQSQLRILVVELNRKASYASRRKNEISVPQISRRQRSMEYIRKEYMGNMHKLVDNERPTTGFFGTLPLLKFADVESIEFTDSIVRVGIHSVVIGGYYRSHENSASSPEKKSNERNVVAIKLYEKNIEGALTVVEVVKEAAILSYLYTEDEDSHFLVPKLIGLLELEESSNFQSFALVTEFIGNREGMEISTMDAVLLKEMDSRKQSRVIIENSEWIEMLIKLAKFIRKCHRKLVVVNNLKLTNIAIQKRLFDGFVYPIPLSYTKAYRLSKSLSNVRHLNSFEPDITQFGNLIKSVDLCLNLGLEKITSHCQTSTPLNLYWSLCDIINALEDSLRNVGKVLKDERNNKKTLKIDYQKRA